MEINPLTHRLLAALLFVPLLLAAGTAGAHTLGQDPHMHGEVLLNGATTLTVLEGQADTVDVTVRCTAGCSRSNVNSPVQRASAYFTISATAPASGDGVTLNSVPRTRFTILPPPAAVNLGTTDADTATLTIAGNTATDGSRTVTVNAAGFFTSNIPDSSPTVNSYFYSVFDYAPFVTGATLTILDDETTSLRVTETGGETEVTEAGGTDSFTVVLPTSPTGASVEVAVSSDDADECEVSVDDGVTYVAAGASGTLTFLPDGGSEDPSIQTRLWNTLQTVTVRGVDDGVLDPGEQCTVRLDPSSPPPTGSTAYHTMPDVTVMVTNVDDEMLGTGLVLSKATVSTGEDGMTDTFTVRLELEPTADVTVAVSSSDPTEATVSPTSLTFDATNWNSTQTVTVTGVDDDPPVPDGLQPYTITMSLTSSDMSYSGLSVTVSGTNKDDDGTENEVTEVLLPEVARAMADSRATAVRQRLERADLGGAPTSPSLTENVNLERLMRHGAAMQEDGELDWKRHLLPQAAFALSLDDDEGMGSDIVLWGGGDYRDLDGEARGVKWDGDVTSAHLGADRLLANGLRVGLAATWSEAKLDYGHQGQKGKWELEMTSAQPYLGWITPGGISLWAMAGVGSGDLEIVAGGQRQKSDADMRMASAGARGPLYAANGTEVSLRGEAMYADFEVDDNGDGIQRQKSDATRLRVAVEARQEKILASGARLLPRFELGVRYDGGDGDTGSGAEVGVGVDYGSGRLGLTAGARTLVANSDYDEWGANVSLVYRAMTDGRGLHITLTPTWGTAESGLQRLWKAGAALYEEDEEDPDSSLKLDGEIGYGRHHIGGLLTPYLGMSVRDEGRHYRLGGRFKLRETLTLNTECERLEQDRADTEHGIGVTVEYRW